jgi:PAS domain S-box-containing protein
MHLAPRHLRSALMSIIWQNFIMNRSPDSSLATLSEEQRFQLLINSISDYAIYLLSPEGYVNSWNVGAQRFKGYLAEEIVGQHFSCFYTEEDQAAGIPAKLLQTALDEGKFESEGWRVRKDGSRFWASIVIDPVRDHSGNLVGFAKVTRDITERKAAQDALRRSEESFRLLVQSVIDYAIYMLSPTGEITNWNAGARRMKGYAEDEVVGTHFSRFYTEQDRASGMPLKALTVATEEGRFEAEGRRVRKDGSTFLANVVIDAIHDDSGSLIGFAKITRDITEHRRAAEAAKLTQAALLQEKTDKYETLLRLFEQAPGFVTFFRGPNHVYELQNEAHACLAQHKDIIGKPVRVALPELEGQGFFELLDQVFATRNPYVGRALPLKVSPSSGAPSEERFIDFIYQPIIGPDGDVIGIISQGSDVTQQVLAQEAVTRKQAELEALILERTQALDETRAALKLARKLQVDNDFLLKLFEQAPGFVAILKGPSHVFDLANQAYYQLVGDRNLIGLPARDAMSDLNGQGLFEVLDQVYATGAPYIGSEVPVTIQIKRDGPLRTLFLDFVYQPLVGDDGKPNGIFVQGHDVTERKLAQDEVKRYQEELETLVSERTQALEDTRAALLQAQKLESIGKLTGGVAHDFNNVLQIVGGNLQLLQPHIGKDEVAATRLGAAITAVERGAKLSSQLLAFARRQPLQPVVVNLGRIMREMDGLLRQALGEGIEIETVVSGGLWNTLVDPHLLENAVLNLAINACDAMEAHGKLTIEIGNAALDDDYVMSEPDLVAGHYVMLAISDTGSGMTPEVLAHAIEPFFTTKPEGKGTGLGLSMVYGFVKQSGGHFRIYSEVGHGTTMRMYFPRSLEAEAEIPVLPSGPLVGGTETILVVEDDIAVQTTVVETLVGLGYRVLKADNAEAALTVLKSGVAVDLLFSDVVMPGQLRSPELARQAKLLLPDIEVLFTSGYTQNAIDHGGRLDPGVQLLSKPYRREQLARKIRHLLANRQQVILSKQPLTTPVNLKATVPPLSQLRVLVVEDNLDAQQMVCELLTVLGYKAKGVGTAEEALAALAGEDFHVLFTDFTLPGMNGVELAKKAKTTTPELKVIFASGYGEAIDNLPDFRSIVLPKPYDLRRLQKALAEL